MMDIILRPEQPSDYRATENLTREAFWNHYSPGCDEHYLLHIMRDCPAFVKELDFVSELNDEIIGNVVYVKSIIKAFDGRLHEVLGLGPISVLPKYQCKGIGRRLIEHTKTLARDMGYPAIFLYGDPVYYVRFGFVAAETLDIRTHDNMYHNALQVCELYDNALSGITGCYNEDSIYKVNAEKAAEFDKTFPPKEKVSGTKTQQRFNELVGQSRKA